ncbi:MAG: hypothetical protein M9936_24465 [Caldilinea sp.]|nr:hypothetical protein [Caldilinea sp.]MCW5843490.1 hypothetical protein [Caldilinea sp.]
MTTVTNDKLQTAGLSATWARWSGFSVLFDNPGASLLPIGDGLARMNSRTGTEPALGFYTALEQTLATLDLPQMADEFAFCPLPSYSYHVTVWDGLNPGNIQTVAAPHRPALQACIDGMPAALHNLPDALSFLPASKLLSTGYGPLDFRFLELVNWSNTAVLARVEAADAASAERLAAITADRQALYVRMAESLGTAVRDGYYPHVTLGYFANREQGELSRPHLAEWNARFAQRMAGLSLTFPSMALYGFSDMISFCKVME